MLNFNKYNGCDWICIFLFALICLVYWCKSTIVFVLFIYKCIKILGQLILELNQLCWGFRHFFLDKQCGIGSSGDVTTHSIAMSTLAQLKDDT